MLGQGEPGGGLCAKEKPSSGSSPGTRGKVVVAMAAKPQAELRQPAPSRSAEARSTGRVPEAAFKGYPNL